MQPRKDYFNYPEPLTDSLCAKSKTFSKHNLLFLSCNSHKILEAGLVHCVDPFHTPVAAGDAVRKMYRSCLHTADLRSVVLAVLQLSPEGVLRHRKAMCSLPVSQDAKKPQKWYFYSFRTAVLITGPLPLKGEWPKKFSQLWVMTHRLKNASLKGIVRPREGFCLFVCLHFEGILRPMKALEAYRTPMDSETQWSSQHPRPLIYKSAIVPRIKALIPVLQGHTVWLLLMIMCAGNYIYDNSIF